MENEKENKEIKEGVNEENSNLDLSWVKGAVEKLHSVDNSESQGDTNNDEPSVKSSNDELSQADTLTAEQSDESQSTADNDEVSVVLEKTEEPKPTQTEEVKGKEVGEEVIDEQQQSVVEEKMLTQSQVNKLMGQAREEGRKSALKDLLAKYGVESDSELDDMFGKGQTYDQLNADYLDLGNANRNVMAENALLKTNIAPERWEDVKLILTGKGLDVTEQSILEHLATHPEWKSSVGSEEPKVLTKDDMEQKVINRGSSQSITQTPSVPRQLGGEVNEPMEETENLKKRLDEIFGM